MARDVVCGMEVDEQTAKFKTTAEGKSFYFYSAGCMKAFERRTREI